MSRYCAIVLLDKTRLSRAVLLDQRNPHKSPYRNSLPDKSLPEGCFRTGPDYRPIRRDNSTGNKKTASDRLFRDLEACQPRLSLFCPCRV